MSKFKVGGSIGYDYGMEFNEAESAGIINVERAPNDETSLKKTIERAN